MPVPTPEPITEAFASLASPNYIQDPIPVPSQVAIIPNAASFETGFPTICFVKLTQGGKPFRGKDLNGILKMMSAYCVALQGGELISYDSGTSAAIGGYALGAVLAKADGSGFWISTTAANVTNPDAGGAGWATFGNLLPCTVAQLPAAAAALTGTRGFVTDATVTTFASVVVGSGSTKVPVYCTGADWRIG